MGISHRGKSQKRLLRPTDHVWSKKKTTAGIECLMCAYTPRILFVFPFPMLDLKPENILLTTNAEYPRVLFSDFGMACKCGDKNVMGTMCGTFAYM